MSRPRPSVLNAFDPLLLAPRTPRKEKGNTSTSSATDEELSFTTFFNRTTHKRPKQKKLRTRLIDVGDTTLDDGLGIIGEDDEDEEEEEALIGFDSVELEFDPLVSRPKTPTNILLSSTANLIPSPTKALLTRVPLTILEEEEEDVEEKQRLNSSGAYRIPSPICAVISPETPPHPVFGASTAQLLPSPSRKMLTHAEPCPSSELDQSTFSIRDASLSQSINIPHSANAISSSSLMASMRLASEPSFDLLHDRVSFFGRNDSRGMTTSLSLVEETTEGEVEVLGPVAEVSAEGNAIMHLPWHQRLMLYDRLC